MPQIWGLWGVKARTQDVLGKCPCCPQPLCFLLTRSQQLAMRPIPHTAWLPPQKNNRSSCCHPLHWTTLPKEEDMHQRQPSGAPGAFALNESQTSDTSPYEGALTARKMRQSPWPALSLGKYLCNERSWAQSGTKENKRKVCRKSKRKTLLYVMGREDHDGVN